jgi:hypothetical protein
MKGTILVSSIARAAFKYTEELATEVTEIPEPKTGWTPSHRISEISIYFHYVILVALHKFCEIRVHRSNPDRVQL